MRVVRDLESAILNISNEEKWTYIHDGQKEQLDHILLSKFTYDLMIDSGVTRIENEVSDHDGHMGYYRFNPAKHTINRLTNTYA